MWNQQTGPGLEIRALGEKRAQFLAGHETALELFSFADLDGSAYVYDLHHADVYRTYRVRVIVQNSDTADFIRASNVELLGDLAFRSGVERGATGARRDLEV